MIFELDARDGLSRVLAGEATLASALQPSGIERLDVLPCGPIPAGPSEMLGSRRFASTLETLVAAYDRIVIDSPPLGHAPDGAVLAAAADATVLVVRLHASTLRLAELAVSTLRNVKANFVGVVANDVSSGHPGSYLDGSWRYSAYARRFALDPVPSPPAALPNAAPSGRAGASATTSPDAAANDADDRPTDGDRFDEVTADRAIRDDHVRPVSR